MTHSLFPLVYSRVPRALPRVQTFPKRGRRLSSSLLSFQATHGSFNKEILLSLFAAGHPQKRVSKKIVSIHEADFFNHKNIRKKYNSKQSAAEAPVSKSYAWVKMKVRAKVFSVQFIMHISGIYLPSYPMVKNHRPTGCAEPTTTCFPAL